MATHPIQENFSGGELSKRARGRLSSDLYKKSLDFDENFQPTAQGSLLLRGGSIFDRDLTAVADLRARVLDLRTASARYYLILFLNNEIKLYEVQAGVATPSLVTKRQMVVNGSFVAGATRWLTRGTVNFNNGKANVDYNGLVYQKITIPVDCTPGGGSTNLVSFTLSDSMKDVVMKVSTSDPAGWGLTSGTSFYDGGGEIREVVLPFRPIGRWVKTVGPLAPGDYYLSFESGPDLLAGAFSVDDVQLYAEATPGLNFPIATPWTWDELKDVKFVTETGRDRTIFVHPGHAPWQLFYQGSDRWEFGDITFGYLPAGWGNASGDAATPNWPSAVEMDNGRVFYGGEASQKNRVVASMAGDPDNFNLASGTSGAVLPGDALDVKLATKGAVRWLRSFRTMLVGTDIGEHKVSGSKGVALAGDIQVTQESAFGSTASVMAIEGGTHAMYVSKDRRKIRTLGFSQDTNGWESKDITFVAEHLTKSNLVKEIHFAFVPEGHIVALLDNGAPIACTFEPGEQVVAWWRAPLPGANVFSAAVTQEEAGAYLWMLVQRNGKILLEKLPLSENAVVDFLDSMVSGNTNGDGIASGLGHLEGLEVRVKVAGVYAGDYVVAGGAVNLGADYATKAFTAGVKFKGKAVTLPKDTRGGKVRSPKVGVILNESELPKINGYRPDSDLHKLNDGKFEVGLRGWSPDGKVTIEQDLPYRTEILAIFEITQANEV